MGGFYTGHHIYIHRCIYTYIYTFFDLFSDQIHHQTTNHTHTMVAPSTTTHQHQSPPKKNFSTDFHTNSQFFTRFHHQKHQKTPKSPKTRKTRKNRLFGGTPHPPKNPYFPGFSGPPKLHKFAQICTNLHQFAPPKHHFWGVPNLPGPSG